jgi:lysophospholipase L1-like esterase
VDECHRSQWSWARLIDTPEHLVVNLRACSGAGIAEIDHRAQWPGELPQVESIDGATRLVTLMVGGNDTGFSAIRRDCLTGGPCAEHESDARAALAKLSSQLPALYGSTLARAPRARLLVVGYPGLFPPAGLSRCGDLGLMDDRDVGWLREKQDELDATIRAAAAGAGAAFVSTLDAFSGHELCTADPWVSGFAAGLKGGTAYHPTWRGQAALAGAVRRVLIG